MIVNGTIEAVSTKEGTFKKGKKEIPWIRTSVNINEEWYQTFSDDLGKQLVAMEGENVSLEWEEQEKNGFTNLNILSVKRSQTPPEAPVSDSNGTRQVEVGHRTIETLKELRIARAVALKAATEVYATGFVDEMNLRGLIDLADEFTDYLLDRKPEAKSSVEEEIEFGTELDEVGLPKGF